MSTETPTRKPNGHTEIVYRPLPRWLLALISTVLVLSFLAFGYVSYDQFDGLSARVVELATKENRDYYRDALGSAEPILLLELNALEQRYQQANSALVTRTWLKYLGFLVGVLVLFAGAIYTLGRFADPAPSKADMKSGELSASIVSASPGLFVSALGTVVILAALFSGGRIDVLERPVYVSGLVTVGPGYLEPSDDGADSSGEISDDELAAGMLLAMEESALCEIEAWAHYVRLTEVPEDDRSETVKAAIANYREGQGSCVGGDGS